MWRVRTKIMHDKMQCQEFANNFAVNGVSTKVQFMSAPKNSFGFGPADSEPSLISYRLSLTSYCLALAARERAIDLALQAISSAVKGTHQTRSFPRSIQPARHGRLP